MADEQQPKARPARSRLDTLDKALGVVITALVLAQYLDVVTHGGVRLYVRTLASQARRSIAPRPPEPSPAEVSAMHQEARAITAEGARHE